MRPHVDVESHQVEMSDGNPSPSSPRDARESATVLCSSPVGISGNSAYNAFRNDNSTAEQEGDGLEKDWHVPVIVRQPVLPDHLMGQRSRYASACQFPTGDRSAEEEAYASVDEAPSTCEDEEDEDNYLVRQLSNYEVVPDLAVDSIDFQVHGNPRQSADIKTTDFPLTSSGSGDVHELDSSVLVADAKGNADQKAVGLDSFPHHMHLEIRGDEIKSASLSDGAEFTSPKTHTSAVHKAHLVALSSDHQLLRVRTRKQEPTSPTANPQVLKRVWSGPLPLTREMEERIESLGPALPNSQKAILWIGIILDIFTKLSILRQMGRFAKYQDWTSFCIALTFFVFSGGCVAVYWWTHYPVEVLDAPGSPSLRRQASTGARLLSTQTASEARIRVYGVSKTDVKRIIRMFGSICAALQLGTAFLATRALFSSETRQRTVAYDLRGMRLVDTIFLTLILCLMQFFVGIRCTSPFSKCHGSTGFSFWLIISIIASLCSSALSFTALDFNDIRIEYDRRHQIESLVFFVARLIELAARVQLLALFAAVLQGQFFTVVCVHMVLVLFVLRFCPHPRRKVVWEKFCTTMEVSIGRFKMKLPQANDVQLLVACMAWPPSCFVSDATGKSGRFWWRDRMVARRPFWSLTMGNALIPWPVYVVMIAGESAAMMGILYPMVQRGQKHYWAQYHFMIAIVLHMLWLLSAAIWAATVHMAAAAASPEDIGRALARKQIQTFKDVERMASAKRSSGADMDFRSHSISSVVITMQDGNAEPTIVNPLQAMSPLQELRGGYSTLPQHYKMPPIRPRQSPPPRRASVSPPLQLATSASTPAEMQVTCPSLKTHTHHSASDTHGFSPPPYTDRPLTAASGLSSNPRPDRPLTADHVGFSPPPLAARPATADPGFFTPPRPTPDRQDRRPDLSPTPDPSPPGSNSKMKPKLKKAVSQVASNRAGADAGNAASGGEVQAAGGDAPAGMTMEAFTRLGNHARVAQASLTATFAPRTHVD